VFAEMLFTALRFSIDAHDHDVYRLQGIVHSSTGYKTNTNGLHTEHLQKCTRAAIV